MLEVVMRHHYALKNDAGYFRKDNTVEESNLQVEIFIFPVGTFYLSCGFVGRLCNNKPD